MKYLMKHLVLTLAFLGCATTDGDWDSGMQRQEAVEEAGRWQVDRRTRDQFPRPAPMTNQNFQPL
jgi:hypothetical protein